MSTLNIEKIERRLLNIPEAAHFLGRTPWGLRTLLWRGIIPFIQTGRKQYVDLRDLETYIEKNKKYAR